MRGLNLLLLGLVVLGLAKAQRTQAAWIEKAKELGCFLDNRMLIHHTGTEQNLRATTSALQIESERRRRRAARECGRRRSRPCRFANLSMLRMPFRIDPPPAPASCSLDCPPDFQCLPVW